MADREAAPSLPETTPSALRAETQGMMMPLIRSLRRPIMQHKTATATSALAANACMAPPRRPLGSVRSFLRPLGALAVGVAPPSPADAHDVFAPPSHPGSPNLVGRSSAAIPTAASPLPPPLGPRAPQRSNMIYVRARSRRSCQTINCKLQWPRGTSIANMRTRAGKITRRLPSPAARLSKSGCSILRGISGIHVDVALRRRGCFLVETRLHLPPQKFDSDDSCTDSAIDFYGQLKRSPDSRHD